jgi:hypothetical protein
MPSSTLMVTTTNRTPLAAFDQRVDCQPIHGHAVRMPNGDGATVDVENILGNAQSVLAINYLHREGFVQFPESDIVHLEIETLQQLWPEQPLREWRERPALGQGSR